MIPIPGTGSGVVGFIGRELAERKRSSLCRGVKDGAIKRAR